MAKYVLTGDIRYAGRIEVGAETLEEALAKADDGDFEVLDQGKADAFDFCGDEDGGVERIEE